MTNIGKFVRFGRLKRLPRFFCAFVFFAALLVSFDVFAVSHVLRAGREKDILALFAPYSLGSKVTEHWKLWSVAIKAQRIDVSLRDPNGHDEHFSLVHPDEALDVPERTSSFAVQRAALKDVSSQEAANLLFQAMSKNDHGGFWEEPKQDQVKPSQPSVAGTSSPGMPRAGISFSRFAIDGVLGLALIWMLGVLLAGRLLRDAPRWMRWALPAIVVAGIVVRLEVSPPALLGAWPWSRVWPNVRAVFEGPALGWYAATSGKTIFLTDVMMWTNFAYAAVMPLILFSHATYLLRDPRAGIAASFALGLLPQHIRFSRCEDAFVPSLVLTSLAFALIHAWLRDPSKVVRGLALAALPFVLYPGYLLRPLNMLFIGVYFAAIALLHPETAPTKRRLVGLGVVVAVGLAAVPSFVSTNEAALQYAFADLQWPARIVDVVSTPRLFVLTDWRVTPLVLVVCAGSGAYLAWRNGERRLVIFLGGWLSLFIAAHAFVVEPAMQPRYHLHLVVPFLLLGAAAVPHLWRKARAGLVCAGIALLAAPWLHKSWIRDLHYSEMQEYAFVREARDVVPQGCTVVEYVGADELAMELRFARIGEYRSGDGLSRRYQVLPAFAPGVGGETANATNAVLDHPPACLYLYQGLACSTDPAANACGALRGRVSADVVKQIEIPVDLYDRRMATSAPRPGTWIPLTLLRVHGPAR